MPTFVYEAMNDAGKTERGEVTAANSEDAIAKIRSQGYFPTSVREQKVSKKKGGGGGAKSGGIGNNKKSANVTITFGGVNKKHLTLFTRQLSTLQDAGLPILRSLQILEDQQKPGVLKNTLVNVYDDVSGGSTLSDSMTKYPKAFDRLYTKMIAAGEVGGVLDVILQRLAEFMEKAARLKKRIIGAMIYPSVVIGVAGMIVTGIMIFIVPKFKKIFEDFDTDLPVATKFLMYTSNWIGGTLPGQSVPGLIYIIFSPPIIIFAIKMGRKTSAKYFIDKMFLYVPVAGQIISKGTIGRFTRTLGTLINAGVPILDALTITRETTGNEVYVRALAAVYESVRQGDNFAEPLRKSRVCDGLVVNMIDVGEETGDLDKMLLKIADTYDEEVDVLVGSLVSLMEPIMVVGLGGIVGFIVIALFMPLVALITNMT